MDQASEGQPLSAAEAGIWYLQQRLPGNACCWIGEYLDIHGPVAAPAFEAALRQVVAAIPSLHARYADDGAGPCRFPQPPADWSLRLEDVSQEADPLETAEARMRALILAAPDGPALFHFALFRVAAARCVWFQAYHHIAMDSGGMREVAARVAQAYTPGAGTGPADAPVEPGRPQSTDQDAARYWRDLLDEWPGPIRLAGRGAEPAPLAIREPVRIDRATVRRMARAGRAAGLRLSHLAVAGAALWLNALGGATDVVLGLAIRPRPTDAPGVAAMMSSIVPVRLAVQASSTLLSLAAEVARQRRASRPHEHYPVAGLLRELSPLDVWSFGPSVNIMPFDYALSFAGHRCVTRNVSLGPIDDLCLSAYDRRDGRGLTVGLYANPVLHAPGALRAFADRLEMLIATVADNPGCPAASIDLLGPDLSHLVLEHWNATTRAVAPAGIADLFAVQARRAPQAPFLAHDGVVLSYAEAAAAASRIAAAIDAWRVAPSVPNSSTPGSSTPDLSTPDSSTPGSSTPVVAILLPRSAGFFTALLGVSIAGAAFLPIDPANPDERIAAMLDDARVAGVVTNQALAARAGGRPIILVGTVVEAGPPPPVRARGTVDPAAPAYVIFTSGTTGRPKGVAVPHRGIASLAAFQAHHLELSASSRILQFAAVGFDAVVMETLMAVSVGACLLLPTEEERLGQPLGRFLSHQAITHALLPPAALQGLDAASQSEPATLVVGGEACPASLARAWSAGRRLINAYGPTESTICATMSDPLSGAGRPPIGRPIWNTRVYVLDPFGRPVLPGIEGELHIAGEGLADGYLGDAATTAARFVPCPFGPGGLMLRTGDRARFRLDGQLDCFGRIDRQIKLRGIRIEPGEIEDALCRIDGIAEAVVIPVADADGRVRLVGYLVPAAGAAPDPAVVRAALSDRVPAAMVPAAFVVLARLPQTRHGKIDLRALPPPAAMAAGSPLETAGERRLAALFTEVLRIEAIDADADFFGLGGDSLSATVLVQRIRDETGCVLTIADVFAHPRLSALAPRIADPGAPLVSPHAVMLPLRGGSSRPALFCIHIGSGLGWGYSGLLRHLDEDQPVYALQARGLDGRSALAPSVAAIAQDYAAEIRRVQAVGPYHLLGWSSGGPLAHAVATFLQDEGASVGLVCSLDGYPASPAYAAGIPADEGRDAAQDELRQGIELYLAAQPILGLDRQDVLDDRVLRRMIEIHINTARLLAAGRLGVLRGDLLLFTCSEAYSPLPMPPPSSWQPHVAGRIDAVTVECRHDAMLLPGPARVIGRIVAERLRGG